MEQFKPEQLLSTAEEFIQHMGPLEWVAAGGAFLALLILLSFSGGKRSKKRKALQVAPQLSLQAFQVSPLGRDAYFKVHNAGQPARLSSLMVKGRKDILVKNAIGGHEISTGESYRILLETSGQQKLDNNFRIELTYMDLLGNVYEQSFALQQQAAKQPRLVRFA